MHVLRLLPILLVALALAAHFLRAGQPGLVAVCLLAPGLLLSRRLWAARVVQGLLLVGTGVWLHTLIALVQLRLATGQPWLRGGLILLGVALATGAAGWLLEHRAIRARRAVDDPHDGASTAAFFLTAAALTIVQLRVRPPMLLPERFLAGAGWVAILGLACYAAWLVRHLQQELDGRGRKEPRWRPWLWRLFSAVFFAQLLLGLAGAERFLMSKTLHLPIPALILAGPLYRGEGLFMVILCGITLLLVGPAWCSYLCYVGAWDDVACRRRPPRPAPRWRHGVRVGLLVALVGVALLLRSLGVSTGIAGGLALGFGLGGVVVMLLASTRLGFMAHCTTWCPLGLVANVLGRISPFRLQIGDGCTGCGACRAACRYDALGPEQLAARRPGLTCTLCGDCLTRCAHQQLRYRFPGLTATQARSLFAVLVVTLHALCLGLARI